MAEAKFVEWHRKSKIWEPLEQRAVDDTEFGPREHLAQTLMNAEAECDLGAGVDVAGLELFGDQPRHDIVLWLALLAGNQRVEIVKEIVERLADFGRRRFRAKLDSGRLMEEVVVLVGNPEQEGDDLRRQWRRKV